MTGVMRSALWLTFFAVILAAWWMMYSMAGMMGVDWIGRPTGMINMGGMSEGMGGEMSKGMSNEMSSEMPMMQLTSFGALFPMWAIMMAAMMLPTMVPTLRSYEDLIVSANGSRAGWLGVILGYFITWVGFAALIALAQIGLMASGIVSDLGIAYSSWVAGGLLILVGLFQFTKIKEVCHGVCHSPMQYFLGHWRTGFGGGLRMGLSLDRALCYKTARGLVDSWWSRRRRLRRNLRES
jgi:predicted metal-binding membrane protein